MRYLASLGGGNTPPSFTTRQDLPINWYPCGCRDVYVLQRKVCKEHDPLKIAGGCPQCYNRVLATEAVYRDGEVFHPECIPPKENAI
jgi:hypothetical protein